MIRPIPLRQLGAYAAFAVPLSMAALPLYVYLPKYYADSTGTSLAAIGAVLLAARALDALQDPWLGVLSDRWRRRTGSRLGLLSVCAPALALSMLLTFAVRPRLPAVAWLASTLFAVYLFFSLASIAYLAHGAEIPADYRGRTRITATREAAGLIGVMAGALLPDLLGARFGTRAGYAAYAWVFAAIACVAAWITRRGSPPAPEPVEIAGEVPLSARQALASAWSNRRFRKLLAVFALSGTAAAIPATLVLFFLQDVITASVPPGGFLALYFACAAIGMPMWAAAAGRRGKATIWLGAMALSVAAFVWAATLGAGSEIAFGIICAATGLALGADLALAPSLLADAIAARESRPGRMEGAYFGLWTLVTKANLGLAAGLALPLVGALGYVPGHGAGSGATALRLVYAGLPCAIRLAALAVLWRWRDELDGGPGSAATQGAQRC